MLMTGSCWSISSHQMWMIIKGCSIVIFEEFDTCYLLKKSFGDEYTILYKS